MTKVRLHRGDIDTLDRYGEIIAIDTETMGLNYSRDRLCVVQLSSGDGTADVVQIGIHDKAPRLKTLITDNNRLKIMHYARFDAAVLGAFFGQTIEPLYCTKVASKLARTYTDKHGLKDLTSELLGVELSKQQQSSDWGKDELSEMQIAYAASDVLYLHALKDKLDAMLIREKRHNLAKATFECLTTRVALDQNGFSNDIFSHS